MVTGRHGVGGNRQVAGGSWVFDASIGQSETTNMASNPSANMAAAAPAIAAVEPAAVRRPGPQGPSPRLN
jgi:hypothetical protein